MLKQQIFHYRYRLKFRRKLLVTKPLRQRQVSLQISDHLGPSRSLWDLLGYLLQAEQCPEKISTQPAVPAPSCARESSSGIAKMVYKNIVPYQKIIKELGKIRNHVGCQRLIFPGAGLLLQGNPEKINQQLTMDEQIELTPYDKRWEFPRHRLKLGSSNSTFQFQ